MALDILETLIRSSPVPLSSALMNEAFPAAVQCTLHTDDSSSQQVRYKFCRIDQHVIFNIILIHFRRKLAILADLCHVTREIKRFIFSHRMEANVCGLMCPVPWIKSASGKMDKVTLLLAMTLFCFLVMT